MTKIILASSSLGRKMLLKYLKVPFITIPSNLDEDKIFGKSLLDTLRLRARLKAEKVAQSVSDGPYTILSADSGAIIDNQLIGKPKDRADAVRILSLLSGRSHRFITSVHIIKIDKNKSKDKKTDPSSIVVYSGETESSVTLRKITSKEINNYLDRTDFTRFAGSYALISAQDFITRIAGSLSNVIGLPLEIILPLIGQKV